MTPSPTAVHLPVPEPNTGYLNETFEHDDCSCNVQEPSKSSSCRCQCDTPGITKQAPTFIDISLEETQETAEPRTVMGEWRETKNRHDVKLKTVTDLNFENNNVTYPDKAVEKCDPGREEMEAPDGGWGYVVVLGAFIVMFMNGMVSASFAILFTEFLLEEGASLTMTTAIVTTQSSIMNLGYLVAGPCVDWWGWRRVVMLGAILTSSGMAMTAFTPSVDFLFFSYSLMTGLGSGCCTVVAVSIPSYYFKKRRGKACAVVTSGANVGTIVGPPLVSYLQLEYGFRGATLIAAAITLHACFSATVFHPVEWHVTGQRNTKVKAPKKSSKEQMLDTFTGYWTLLKSSRTYVIAIAFASIAGLNRTGISLVPLILERSGHTQSDAAFVISIIGICGLIGRIMVPSLTDTAWFNVRVAYIGCLIITIVALIVFSLVTELLWISVAMSFFGIGLSGCYSLTTLAIIHYMGLKNQVPLLAFSGIATVVLLPSINPLYGVFERLSGGYSGPILFLSGQACLAAVLWLLMPLAVTFDKRRLTTSKQNTTEAG